MRRPKHSSGWVLLLVGFLLVFPIPRAHAYLDPGTGSFMLQLGLGALFGVLFTLKGLWGRITGVVGRHRGETHHREL